MTDRDIEDILKENKRRNDEMFAYFNPATGEGSVGERFLFHIPDYPIPNQYLPVSMAQNRLVIALAEAGTVENFIRALGKVPDEDTREDVVKQFSRLRQRHDFPYWCITWVTIKNKEPGMPDCKFRLNFPQRRYCAVLEEDRLANRPIRINMCKARQWGGSTETDMYMAWLQLVLRPSLNGIILAHVNAAAEKIKAMYTKMLDAYPVELLHEPGEIYDVNEKKIKWVGKSGNTQLIPQRNCTLSIGSSESPNNSRSGDYALAHLSEVGFFVDSEKIHPKDLVRSSTSGILYKPYTMIVYESTADGVGTFFHKEYMAAVRGKSQFRAFFVAWFEIEQYRIEFFDEEARIKFAKWLFDNRKNANTTSDREEPGEYLWLLWTKGASLEAINWYIVERRKYTEHSEMAAEYPSDAIEAFVNANSNVFDKYHVEALRPACHKPAFIGDVYGDALKGEDALKNVRFISDSQGELWIWSMPDNDPDEEVTDRYLTIVDVGGTSKKADWTDILVLDRFSMMDGGRPEVVAECHYHSPMDLMAWKAAQIAAFYNNSLLVIESNTLETHDPARKLDGDQSQYILELISGVYPNLYARKQAPEDIEKKKPRKWGFHTNTHTKPVIIENLKTIVREASYIERNDSALDEMLVFERKPDGSTGAVTDEHDDRVMTRAIGLYICFFEMEMPQIVIITPDANPYRPPRPVSAATIA